MHRLVRSILCLSLLAPAGLSAQNRARNPKGSAAEPSDVATMERLQRLESELEQQRAQIAQQQAEIGQLEQQLRQNAAELQAQGRKLQDSMQQTASAERTASAAANSNANAKNLEQSLLETRKSLQALEHPPALQFKGITLTPGGYLAADVLERTRNENADVATSFGNLPFGGVANSHLTEFRTSARSSRLTLLAQGMAGSTRLTGYYEIDFLGQAPTANQVETNSFNPRQRQLWAQADFSNGLTLTAGQDWSLLTTDRRGIATRAEFIPNTLEASYLVGYNYARQTAFRLTKNFQNRWWVAFELANPETEAPSASYAPPNVFGFNNSANASSPNGFTINYLGGTCPASSGFLCNPSASAVTNGFSTNLAPDVIAKVAWEPGWGHYELKALGRFFRDRVNGSNNVSYGGGLGAAAILPVVRNQADFIFEGLAGSGIGRYSAGLGPDITLRPDGHIIPTHAVDALAGLELHPQPKLDLYVYGGNEYYGRAAYVNPNDPTKPAGYGSPLVDNSNCGVEVLPAGSPTCGAQNRDVWQATAGLWYRFYKGPFGSLQYGAQYEYLHRTAWAGQGGAPKGLDSVAMTSFRYYLP
jgi:hypothetical protein